MAAESTVITCPECKKKFKGKLDLEGKKIRCPFCEKAFVVKLDAAAKAKAAAAKEEKDKAEKEKAAVQAAEAPKPNLLDDDDEGSNPYAAAEQDLTPRCPNCANPLESKDAVICLYCGYNTLTREVGRTERLMGHTFGQHFVWLLPGMLCMLGIFVIIIGLLYHCLVLPGTFDPDSALRFLDHESMRLWPILMSLSVLWSLGMFAYSRLILHPKPPKVEKE